MRNTLLLFGAAALLATTAACADMGSKASPSGMGAAASPVAAGPALPTPDYITAAGQSDQFEIQEGQLAASRSQNPKVRDFGQMMVKDHTMTTQNLMAAIQKAGMTPPPPPPLRPDQQQMMTQLQGATGADFDKMYVSQQIQSHQEALQVHSGYAAGGTTPALKAVAKQTVPIVQHHLDMATRMQSMMAGG